MEKPKPAPVNPKHIPAILKALPRWVVWRYEWRGGKWAKPPRQACDRYAASNDPSTWCEYPEALAAYKTGRFDGVGIVLPNGIVGIDLDDCLIDGKPTELAKMVGAMFPTYCEISPSGQGLKLLAAGQLAKHLSKTAKAKGVEIYDGGDTNRYFTVTGNLFGSETAITGQTKSLVALQSMITDPKPIEINQFSDIERAAKGLEFLAHIPQDLNEAYDTWLAVGMALHWCDNSTHALTAWMDWSSTSDKYTPEACQSKWESFGRESGRLLTLTYLQKLALENGYNPDRYQTGSISAPDLLAKTIIRDYLIEDLLVVNEPMIIGGASKALKTSVALEMALSLATGAPFLGRFKVSRPLPVMFLSGESGEATLQESLAAMIGAKDLPPGAPLGNLHFSFKLPKLNDAQTVDDLVAELKAKDIGIMFLDPLYRSLQVGDQASNVYAMGEKLEWIAEKIHRAGITVILLHHFRKQGRSYDPPELEDLSQAGIAEFGRQFLLLKRTERYEHDGKHSLWFTWGGSAGHQGESVLEVYTGTRKLGLTWQTTLRNLAEWEAHQADSKKVEKLEEKDDLENKILEAIGANPGLNGNKLWEKCGGKKAFFLATLAALEGAEKIRFELGKRNSKEWYLKFDNDSLV